MRQLLLAALLALPAAAAQRENAGPVPVPRLETGLGSASTPALPSASLTPPSLPPSALPQGAPQASAPAPAAAQAAKAVGPQAQARVAEAQRGPSLFERAGVPKETADVLEEFASDPALHPDSQEPLFEGAPFARRVAELTAQQAVAAALQPERRAVVLAAAALGALGPKFVDEDPRAAALLAKLEARGVRTAEVKTLARAMSAPKVADGDAFAKDWAARLSFAARLAPFTGETIDVQRGLERLAKRVGLSADAGMARGARELAQLKRDPLYKAVPAAFKSRADTASTILDLYALTDEAPAAPSTRSTSPRGPPRGDVLVGGKPLTVAFDRVPGGMEATFMATDGTRRLAVKTARYTGVSPKSVERQRADLEREARLTRRAGAVAAQPGFPANVSIARVVGEGGLTPALARQVFGDESAVPAILLLESPGRTLQVHLAAGGTLSRRDFQGLLDAYAKLHAAGFVHGDPNLGNILIAERGGRQFFTILDFNASKEKAELDAGSWRDYVSDERRSVEEIAGFFESEVRLRP